MLRDRRWWAKTVAKARSSGQSAQTSEVSPISRGNLGERLNQFAALELAVSNFSFLDGGGFRAVGHMSISGGTL